MSEDGKLFVEVMHSGGNLYVLMGRTEDTRKEFRFVMRENGSWVVNQADGPGNPVMTLEHWRALVDAVEAFLASDSAE